jgi:HEAT repeat protein
MRAALLALAAAIGLAPAAALAGSVDPAIAKMEAEGEKFFNEASNTDLSTTARNDARKKAWVQLWPALEALNKHWDAHPEDQSGLEARVSHVGKMVYWLRKESPVGLLESTGVGPKPEPARKPAGWGDKPPPEKPGEAPPAPPSPGGGPAPGPAPAPAPAPAPGPAAAPAGPTIEDSYKEADAYARKHRADLPGIAERFQAVMAAHPDKTSHALWLEAAKRSGEATRALKDFYRLRRDDDPDSLKNADTAEVKAMALALGREAASRDPEVRRRAASLLALLGSADGVFPLVQAAAREQDAAVQAAMLDAVVQIGGRKAAEQLGKLRDGPLGMKAVDGLGRMCGKNRVELRIAAKELGRCAQAKDEGVARAAVDLLVGLGADGALGLVDALDSKSTEVRLKIIPALGATKNPKVARPLARFLLSGDNPAMERCRDAAKEAIKGLGEPAVPYLFAGLRDSETKAHTALLLREMTGQMFSMSRPGDWVNWWKQTHPDWKEEGEEK